MARRITKDQLQGFVLMKGLNARQMEIVNELFSTLSEEQADLFAEFVDISGQLSDIHDKIIDDVCKIIDLLSGVNYQGERPKLKLIKKADG